MGKYDEKSKYNAKNISRNILKQKDIICTVPYNFLLMEATQEGRVIDLLIDFLNIKNKDENYLLIEELERLDEKILRKVSELQLTRRK